jgi:hypothetical protein
MPDKIRLGMTASGVPGAEMSALRIIRLINGGRTPVDGKWVVEYDPTRPGLDPNGRPIPIHLVVTDDPEQEAKLFPSNFEALEYWRQPSGQPAPRDRPLTAYTVYAGPISGYAEP